jgi:hypothetical protein
MATRVATVTAGRTTKRIGRIVSHDHFRAFGANKDSPTDPGRLPQRGYHSVTACLVAEEAGALFDFAQTAFGATVKECMRAPDGRVRHAEFVIGGSSIEEPDVTFCGDKTAAVRDPQGKRWWIATHVQDVPPEEVERRAAAVHGAWPKRWSSPGPLARLAGTREGTR